MLFTPTISFENNNFDANGLKFGVLNITTENNDICNNLKPIHIRFNNDISSSMDDNNDNKINSRSKIYYLKKTMIGILRHLASISETTNITISIYNFETSFNKIVSNVKVTKENLEELTETINKIRAYGSTNFENIMTNSFDELNNRLSDNPDNIYADILMTDGDITDGESNIDKLKKYINPNIINAFIGYGYDQNSVVLNSFSKVVNGSYSCIDNVEKGALVYGEILSNIINVAFVKVNITIQNGLIYDWKENKFVSSLIVDNIVWGSIKSFHIISESPQEVLITIKCVSSRTGEEFEINVSEKSEGDLTNFRYRHRVLDLLDRIKSFNEKNYLFNKDFNLYIEKEDNQNKKLFNQNYKQNMKLLKTELCDLFKEIKLVIDSNKLEDDKFYKRLLDDLYVTHVTFGTRYSNMFTCARQYSQGQQRIYSAIDTPIPSRYTKDDEEEVFIPRSFSKISRCSSITQDDSDEEDKSHLHIPLRIQKYKYFNDFNDFNNIDNGIDDNGIDDNIDNGIDDNIDDNIDNGVDDLYCHNISYNCEDTPYSNFNTINTMRSVSNRHYDAELNIEENTDDSN